MTYTQLLLIIAAILVVRFVWQSLQAREHALKLAKVACNAQGVQFLDSAVPLKKITFEKDFTGKTRLIRYFRFEFTLSGDERRQGMIALSGYKQHYIYLDLPEQPVIDVKE